jgi:hypothetical protein
MLAHQNDSGKFCFRTSRNDAMLERSGDAHLRPVLSGRPGLGSPRRALESADRPQSDVRRRHVLVDCRRCADDVALDADQATRRVAAGRGCRIEAESRRTGPPIPAHQGGRRPGRSDRRARGMGRALGGGHPRPVRSGFRTVGLVPGAARPVGAARRAHRGRLRLPRRATRKPPLLAFDRTRRRRGLLLRSGRRTEPDRRGPSLAFVDWHRGARSWRSVLRSGDITLFGPAWLRRSFPTWNRHVPVISR